MRIPLPVFVMAVVLACVWAGSAPADVIEVRSRPVVLDAADPARTRIGRLEWRGGVELTSPDGRFGGLSSLRVAADGSRFTAISDEGWRLDGRFRFDMNGRLAGVDGATLVPLLSRRGRPLPDIGKQEIDAESLVREADGSIIVGFEGNHRIVRYPADGSAASVVPPPPGLQEAPENEGIETLVRLADGRLLAITEGLAVDGGVRGWIGDGRLGGWRPLVWRTSERFVPTDAALLPSGDVLILERRFPPVGARLRLLPATSVVAGAILDGAEIARFEGSLTADNMEGIDARRGPSGETLIWLISDDNFSFLQRTLLLMFRLVE